MNSLTHTLPRRHPDAARDLAHAVEDARLLSAVGDAAGAARVLDEAFAAEGVRAPAAPEPLRFRALVRRADLALVLHETRLTRASAPHPGAGAEPDALRRLADELGALDAE